MLVAVTALLVAAQGDSPDLRCILDGVPAATRTALFDESLAGNQQGPAFQALVTAAGRCRQQRGWTEDTVASLGMLSRSLILYGESRSRLVRVGLNPQLITDWFDQQTEAVRTGPPTGSTLERLLAHLRSAGVTQGLIDAEWRSIVAFFASRARIEHHEDASN